MALFRRVISTFVTVFVLLFSIAAAQAQTADVYLPGETYSATDTNGATVSITILTYNQTYAQFETDAWAHYIVADVEVDGIFAPSLLRMRTDPSDGAVLSHEILVSTGDMIDVLGTTDQVEFQNIAFSTPSPSPDGSYVALTFSTPRDGGSTTWGALIDDTGATPIATAFGGDPTTDFNVSGVIIVERAVGPYVVYSGEGLAGADRSNDGVYVQQIDTAGPDPLPGAFTAAALRGDSVTDIPTGETSTLSVVRRVQGSTLGGAENQVVAETIGGSSTCPLSGSWNGDLITFESYCSAQCANPDFCFTGCSDASSCSTSVSSDTYDLVWSETECSYTESYTRFAVIPDFGILQSPFVGVTQCDGTSATVRPLVLPTGEVVEPNPSLGIVTSGLGTTEVRAQGEPFPPATPPAGNYKGDPTTPNLDEEIVVAPIEEGLETRTGEAVTCGSGWENFVARDGAAAGSICNDIGVGGTTTPFRGIIFELGELPPKPVAANFDWAQVASPPGTIAFTNLSTPAEDCGEPLTYQWVFDVSGPLITSSEENPSHTYDTAGDYLVRLTASHCEKSDSITKTVTVEPNESPPEAGFLSSQFPDKFSAFKVDFTDTSTDVDGTVVKWMWEFGDGETSTAQNPDHIYSGPGPYTVTLTVEDNDGLQDSISVQIEVITQKLKPDAEFTALRNDDNFRQFVFTDDSRDGDGEIVAWNWTFGDGTSSSDQNPLPHTYPETKFPESGKYGVVLTVTDNDGLTDEAFFTVLIPELLPLASFDAEANPENELQVDFTDTSDGFDDDIESWSWDFGDGSTSDEQNPSHTYAEPGEYLVTLTITDTDGASKSVGVTIFVGDDPPGICEPELRDPEGLPLESLSFAAAPGDTERRSVWVINQGDADCTITGIAIVSEPRGDLTLFAPRHGLTIAPGEFLWLTDIQFAPTNARYSYLPVYFFEDQPATLTVDYELPNGQMNAELVADAGELDISAAWPPKWELSRNEVTGAIEGFHEIELAIWNSNPNAPAAPGGYYQFAIEGFPDSPTVASYYFRNPWLTAMDKFFGAVDDPDFEFICFWEGLLDGFAPGERREFTLTLATTANTGQCVQSINDFLDYVEYVKTTVLSADLGSVTRVVNNSNYGMGSRFSSAIAGDGETRPEDGEDGNNRRAVFYADIEISVE